MDAWLNSVCEQTSHSAVQVPTAQFTQGYGNSEDLQAQPEGGIPRKPSSQPPDSDTGHSRTWLAMTPHTPVPLVQSSQSKDTHQEEIWS